MSAPSLPRWFVAALDAVISDPVARAGLVGDLEERYGRLGDARALRRAMWLLAELVAVGLHYTWNRDAEIMDGLKQDLGFALRSLARRPGFSALLIITLALGIGANTAIFSVVNGLLLEPLPFDDADRLAVINEREASGFTASVSFPNYRDWKERAKSFDRFATILPSSRRLSSRWGGSWVGSSRRCPWSRRSAGSSAVMKPSRGPTRWLY